MLVFLSKLEKYIDNLNEFIGRTVSWLTLFMVVITFSVVVLRYLFNVGWIAVQESVFFMHSIVFLLGAAYTLKHDGHVRVDIFYRGLSARGKAWVDAMGVVFLLLPVSCVIFWLSLDYVTSSWELMEGSREAGGLPGIYILKTSLLIMPSLLVLQGVSQLIKSIIIIKGKSF